MAVKHSKVSAVSDGGDTSLVRPSDWNADHTIASNTVTEDQLSIADNTTKNASTSMHGFLPKLPGGTTDFLRADGTFAAPGGGSRHVYTTTVAINNTTTETDIFPAVSLTGGTLGTTGGLRIAIIGNLNHGVEGTCTFRVYHNTTVIATVACTAGTVSASKPMVLTALILNLGAQNSQQYEMDVRGNDGNSYTRVGVGTAAADTSATQNIKVTAQWGAASASLTFTSYAGLLEILP